MSASLRVIVDRYPALGEFQYLKYFVASLGAVGATQMMTFGQLWLIYELTESPIMLGWLGAAAAIPNLTITLFGGVIADRYDKREILKITSGGNMLLAALLTSFVIFGIIEVWHLLAIAAASSILNGFDWPVRVAIFPQLVERNAYLSAVALNSFVWQVTRMAIPAFAGFLLFYTDVSVVFGIATVGYLGMYLTLHTLRMRDAEAAASGTHALAQIGEGISFIFKNHIFKYLLMLTFVGMFFCNSHSQLMPMFAALNLTDEVGLGLLMTAGGIGSLIGTLVIGINSPDRNLSQTMLYSGALTCLTTIAFAVVSAQAWLMVSLCLQFAAAFFGALFLITSMTTMQLSVPDQLRGRVMGIHTMGYSLLPLGGLFLGSLTEFTNAVAAVATGSLVYLLLLVLVLVGISRMRNLRSSNLYQLPLGTADHPKNLTS